MTIKNNILNKQKQNKIGIINVSNLKLFSMMFKCAEIH